jgi:glutaredoxin 3
MFVIYGKTVCPFCVKAKEFLEEKSLQYEYISLDDAEVLASFKRDNPDVKTVPYILKDGYVIGGYNDLTYYVNSYEYGPQ